jgi:CRISPR type I-E-associated protein CasB/Cse2
VAGGELKGNVGDPWIPIDRERDSAAYNIKPTYRAMARVLFEPGAWIAPLLLEKHNGIDAAPMVARFEVFVRGQGKTEGYHSVRSGSRSGRSACSPPAVGKDELARLSEGMVGEARTLLGNKVLRAALLALLQGGPDKIEFKDATDQAWADKLLEEADREVDRRFFDFLGARVEDEDAAGSAGSASSSGSPWRPSSARPRRRRCRACADRVRSRWPRGCSAERYANFSEPCGRRGTGTLTPPDADPTDPRRTVRAIAGAIGAEHYPPGRLAELRRLDPDAPQGAAFWTLLLDHAPGAVGDVRAEQAWAAVLRGMALMVPHHRPADRADGRGTLGEALAVADVSEPRFLRLLRVGGGELPGELRRLARLMAAKGAGFDWTDAWWLLRTAGGAGAEATRRRLARDYYRKLHALRHPPEAAA